MGSYQFPLVARQLSDLLLNPAVELLQLVDIGLGISSILVGMGRIELY